ncbi:hypothetical protein [Cerasicoccus frondis]|uniref:hypothetical protein n=1 Tax=Cerasicoccus frondis TaxID=490090 RepID=UPI0028528B73|nr:hypothetical protein [Cerasicoccus frondis]
MNTTSLTPPVAQARVHPRRKRPIGATDSAEVAVKPVYNSFHAPLEKSEVRRRFAGIYEQAFRIVYRGE